MREAQATGLFGLGAGAIPMKILFVTQWFDPEPTFKGLIFVKALVQRGHTVEVLTGFPNYPGGKTYPGFRIRPFQRDTVDGVSVLRVALYPSHDSSGLRRALNYISFAITASIAAMFLTRRADVAYVYHPPATIGLAALVLRWLRRTPVVLDVQDLWPDTLMATGMIRSKALLAAIGTWCELTYRLVTQIVVLSAGFRERLIACGVPRGKVEVIYNWCDENALTNSSGGLPKQEQAVLMNHLNVVFAGNLGLAQGLDTVLDAARIVASTHPHVQFVLVGGGIDLARLRTRVESEGIPNVIFLPRRPPEAMADVYFAADALLVHLRDEELFAITIPSKTQAYLLTGQPIIMGVRGDAADLVRRAEAGVACPPQNPEALADAVRSLADMSPADRRRLGENGRRFYSENLSLHQGVNAFERTFLRSVEGFHL